MPFILIILFIVVALIIVTRINNNKPLSEWSDDKLKSTHEKSLVVADVLQKRGRTTKAKDYVERANKLKVEMDRRNIS